MFRIVATVLISLILHISHIQAQDNCCNDPRLKLNIGKVMMGYNSIDPNMERISGFRPPITAPNEFTTPIKGAEKLKPFPRELTTHISRMFPYENCNSLSAFRWVKASFPLSDDIANKAVKDINVQRTSDDTYDAYVGRVYYQNNLIPAAVVPKRKTVFFSYKGQKLIETKNFEVLIYQKPDFKVAGFEHAMPIAYDKYNASVYFCWKDQFGQADSISKTCTLFNEDSDIVESGFELLIHDL